MFVDHVHHSTLAFERSRVLRISDEIWSEIRAINEAQLRTLFVPPTTVDGFVPDSFGKVMFRRAVRFEHVSWFDEHQDVRSGPTPRSWDYFSLYRYLTEKEQRRYGDRGAVMVVSVVHESQFRPVELNDPQF